MRVLMLLSKTFRQDPRVHKEARALIDDGHAVTVLEWARHQPNQVPRETIDGIDVVRFVNTRFMARLPGDLWRNPGWWHHAVDVALRLHHEQPFDVVHAHDLDTLAPAVRLKRRLGIRVVFDAHEIFRMMLEGNLPPPVPAVAERLERRLLPHVDLLVTASESFRSHYERIFDGPIVVTWNCFGEAPGDYVPPMNDVFTVVYIGTLSTDRLFPGLADAFGAMDDVRLVVGGKKEGVYDEVATAAARYANVRFLGPVPFDEVLGHTASADAVISMLDPKNPQYQIQVPNKLFDAMSTGRPLIATEGTASGGFVAEHDVGVACPYTEAGVQAAVRRLQDDDAACRAMGERGLVLARERFHWEAQARGLQEAYRALDDGGRL